MAQRKTIRPLSYTPSQRRACFETPESYVVQMTRFAAHDLTNRVFGRLRVVRRGENKGGKPAWHCQCQCGNLKFVRADDLRREKTRSCGDCDTLIEDIETGVLEARPLSRLDPVHVVKPRTTRRDKPAIRVRSALRRLSRDRWLPAQEVQRIALRLAECTGVSARNGMQWRVAQSAVSGEAWATVGLLRGEPPRRVCERGYGEFVASLKDRGLRDDLRNEHTLLSLELRNPR